MLFTQFSIKDVSLKNRIMMPPMAQYCATENGFPTSWHFVHYATRAVGGVGLIMFEVTAVESRGRISGHDLGLWNEEQKEALKDIITECKKYGAAVGVQLGHAGRKCEAEGEQPVAPSSFAWSENYKIPDELTKEDIKKIIIRFKNSARRALEAGFDVIEVHAAHGYLIHEFLSPLANFRKDEYGGSIENRARLLQEIVTEIREVWPSEKPLFVRVSADDYLEGGLNINEMLKILSYLKGSGIDVIHVSSGGLLPAQIKLYPGYQVPYSKKIREELGFTTIAVGLISDPQFAQEVLVNGEADLIALGRELLRNPYWPLMAANSLGTEVAWPIQYERARPR